MPTTPVYALPYPSNSDDVDVPGDMQSLAEAVDILNCKVAELREAEDAGR